MAIAIDTEIPMKTLFLCIAFGLSGCSGDPKAPTKENFAKAAQAYLDTHPLCVAVTDANSEVRITRGFDSGYSDAKPAPTLDSAKCGGGFESVVRD